MKVLLLIDNFGSGGAQRQMVTLASMLQQHGEQVSFLVYDKSDFFRKRVDELGIPVEMCCTTNIISRMFRIRCYIRRGGFDAVVSFMDTPNFLNCFAAVGGHSWRVVTSERSCKEEIFQNFKNRIFNLFQHWSDALVCNSESARQMWLRHKPGFADKLHTIYNPVILPPTHSEYVPRRNGRTNIVVAASFQQLKNPTGLVNALALLAPEQRKRIHVDWYGKKCVAFGGSATYRQTEQIITDNGLQDVCELHDPVGDIIDKMNEADAVGLFSTVEGLPNAICEGMMLGKPIVMSEVSDYRVLIDSNGIVCDIADNRLTAESLIRLCNTTEEELTRMGRHSKSIAEHLFCPQTILSQWLEILTLDKE